MKRRTYQYQKIEVKPNDFIENFYVIMMNQVQIGHTIQDKKTAKAVVDWLHSLEESDVQRANARS